MFFWSKTEWCYVIEDERVVSHGFHVNTVLVAVMNYISTVEYIDCMGCKDKIDSVEGVMQI